MPRFPGKIPQRRLYFIFILMFCFLFRSRVHITRATLMELDGKFEVEDGKGGFFVEPGDDKQLADAVIWMFEHQEEATQMGVSGCEYVANNFNRENDARNFCDLIEKVLAQ